MPQENGGYYFTLQLNVTNVCNLSCRHCYHADHLQHAKLTLDQHQLIVQKFLHLCSKWNVRPHLILTGGEPFLYRYIQELCEFYDDRSGCSPLSILTNATLITKERIKNFKKYNTRMFQVSLDGPNATVHDNIRGFGAYVKTIAGIKLLLDEPLPVSINVVLSKQNADVIEEYFILAQSIGINRVTFTRFVPTGIGKNILDQMLQPQDLQQAYQRIISASKDYSIESNFNDGLFSLLDSQMGSPYPIGLTAMVVADDGSILPSSRIPISIGNALCDDLEEIWLNHPLLVRLRDRSCHECSECPYFKNCGGNEEINYAYWGKFHKTDPQCWKAYDTLHLPNQTTENEKRFATVDATNTQTLFYDQK